MWIALLVAVLTLMATSMPDESRSLSADLKTSVSIRNGGVPSESGAVPCRN